MTKVFVMATCPDCTQVKAQLAGNPAYELIDIGEHVRNLKRWHSMLLVRRRKRTVFIRQHYDRRCSRRCCM